MANLITTAEAATLIHRSPGNTSGHLQKHGLKPISKGPRGVYLWSRPEIERLVAEKPDLQERRVNSSFNSKTVNLRPPRSKPKRKPEWAVVCATAAARMAAGIRVGERERYGEVPELTIEDVPAWVWEELGTKGVI